MKQKRVKNLLDTVLNPQGQPTQGEKPSSIFLKEGAGATLQRKDQPANDKKSLSMAPRLDTLDGKTIYLVDIGFGGGYEFLEEMEGWFSKNMPTVKTVIKRKVGNMFMDDPNLWIEIKEKGDALVMGVGG